MTTTTKTRTAPAISATAEGFAGKVRTALLASVEKGVGEVRVKVADPSDRTEVRKVQKKVQGIGYSSGFNANFRVTLAGDILTGRVVDLTRESGRPGETAPTPKTPGTRSTFVGWTPAQISAWKRANPVKSGDKGTTTTKGTKGTKSVKGTPTKRRATKRVTKVTKTPQTVPDAIKGVTSVTPIDTTTVTVTTV